MKEIVFDKIEISGFLSIGYASIDLSNQGFILVKGINNESISNSSNGSGKSSVFEAIFWTLTGETLRGSSEVVNEHTTKGCVCTLLLHDDLNNYEIKRSKKHKDLGSTCLFYINGDLISDQVKKSQMLINQTIPSVSDPEILGSVILLGQGLPHKFSSFTPIKRKELLETIISSSEAEELSNALKTKSVEVTSKISQLTLGITKIDGQIQGLSSTLDYLNHEKNTLRTKEEIDKERQELKKKQKELIEKQEENNIIYQTLETDMQVAQKQKTSLNQKLQQLQVSLATTENYLSSFKSGNCPTCGRPYDITPESEQVKQSLEYKKGLLTSQVSTNQQYLTEIDTQIKNLTQQLNQKLQDRYALDLSTKEITNAIAKLDLNEQNKSELDTKIKQKEEEITTLKINQQEMIKKSEVNRKQLEYIDYMLRLTSREFKSYLIKEVIDYLSSRVTYYSSYLFDNKSVTMSLSGNKLLIALNNRPYENLSGGERQRTDLIIQFALRDLLMVISGFSANMMIMDEVFDNLDSSGSSKLINLIVTELSDIDSVFVVTHHEELGIPSDRQLIVEKDSKGISTARIEV